MLDPLNNGVKMIVSTGQKGQGIPSSIFIICKVEAENPIFVSRESAGTAKKIDRTNPSWGIKKHEST